MPLKNNYNPGDKVLAADLNALVNATMDSEHNILELYMENYFASKITPFQGLMFDGFDDTTKTITPSGAMVSGASGQPDVFVTTQAERDKFVNGDLVHISDASAQEVNTVQSLGTGSLTDVSSQGTMQSGASWAYAETDPDGDQFFDDGLDSGARKLRANNGGSNFMPASRQCKITKTFTGLTVGVVYSVSVDWKGDNNRTSAGFQARVLLDGTSIGAAGLTNSLGAFGTSTYTFTATATSHDISCQLFCNSPDINWPNGSQAEVWYKNLTISHTAFKVTMANNLANTYGTGTVKFTSASLGGKLLQMTAGIGDLKRVIYQMIPSTFSQLMSFVTLWISRLVTVQLQPNASVALGDTTVAQQGVTASFATGDIMDIYTADKTVRERKTITNVVETGGGAVVIDQVTTDLNSTITQTVSHVTNVHSDRVLVVAVNCFSPNNGGGLIPTGVTYNGVAMTLQVSGNNGNGRNGLSFWKVLNPATGTNNLVVTYASAPSSSSSSSRVTIIGFYNARDTTAGQNFGFVVNSWSKSVTSETNGISIDLCGNDLGNPSQSAGGGQTVRSSDNFRGFCSTLASTGVTTSMGGGNGGYEGNYMGISVLPVRPLLTLTFSPAIVRSAGFTTSDFFERVDVLPKISVGASGSLLSYADLTYIRSVILTIDTLTYTEDEYTYTPGTPNQKIGVRVDITRSNTGFTPNAKRLGLSLNT